MLKMTYMRLILKDWQFGTMPHDCEWTVVDYDDDDPNCLFVECTCGGGAIQRIATTQESADQWGFPFVPELAGGGAEFMQMDMDALDKTETK